MKIYKCSHKIIKSCQLRDPDLKNKRLIIKGIKDASWL